MLATLIIGLVSLAIVLPMALAGGGSYKTLALTRHSETNVEVIRRFLDVRVETRGAGKDAVVVEVSA